MKTCKTCKLENHICVNRKNYGIFGWTVGCEDFWEPKPQGKLEKAIASIETETLKSYSSVDEMMKSMDEEIAKEKRERPFHYYGTRFYYRWIERPCVAAYHFIVYEIPHWIKYGYSRKDIWSFDYKMARWVLPRLKEIRDYAHGKYGGIPGICIPDDAKLDEFGNPTQEEWDKAGKHWLESIDKIVLAFELIIENVESFETDTLDFDKNKQIQYEEGMELFRKYYRSLYT